MYKNKVCLLVCNHTNMFMCFKHAMPLLCVIYNIYKIFYLFYFKTSYFLTKRSILIICIYQLYYGMFYNPKCALSTLPCVFRSRKWGVFRVWVKFGNFWYQIQPGRVEGTATAVSPGWFCPRASWCFSLLKTCLMFVYYLFIYIMNKDILICYQYWVKIQKVMGPVPAIRNFVFNMAVSGLLSSEF